PTIHEPAPMQKRENASANSCSLRFETRWNEGRLRADGGASSAQQAKPDARRIENDDCDQRQKYSAYDRVKTLVEDYGVRLRKLRRRDLPRGQSIFERRGM